MDCPSTECHQTVERMRNTLWGINGAGGLVANYVTRRTVVWVCITLLTMSSGFLSWGWTVWAENDRQIVKNTTNIEQIQKDISEIKATVQTIKKEITGQETVIRNAIRKEFEDLVESALKAKRDLNEYNRNTGS